MRNRFTFVASCLSFLAAGLGAGLPVGGCTSSNPQQVTDLAMTLDMSVSVDLATPPDQTVLPPDLVPGCGFGQTLTAGSCACDAAHPTLCTGNVYCCGGTQTCLPTAGPRGETRCSGPSVRESPAMGYDLVRNNLILRTGTCLDGGQNPVLCTDQWTLGQVTWDVQQPATAITPRLGSIMAWLPSKQQLLLFGGQTILNNAGSAVNDLYAWTGTDWSKLAPATLPSARTYSAMAYDAGRQVMVLFGGTDKTNTAQSDTWEYNGTTWKMLAPANEPNAREGHGMVYDPGTKRIVVHAGLVAGAYDRDTWVYDGNDWTQLANNAAMAVHGYFAMAYDPGRGVTVLYGGENTAAGNTVVLGETWEFNGTTWAQRTPAVTPGKRTKAAMAYDQGRKQMVLFGGNNGTTLLKDAWSWNGTTWTQIY